jgi:hypothetical protein
MSAPIIPLLLRHRRIRRLGHPLRQTFILGSLLLFVLVAAFPAENRRHSTAPCHPLVSDDPLHLKSPK